MTNSQDAADQFRAYPDNYDLIVADQTMPNLTGLELSARVRTYRPDIPILLCSGYNNVVDKEALEQHKINRYLEKPLDVVTLLAAVDELTGRQGE